MEIDESQLRILSMRASSVVDNIGDAVENEEIISVCKHCSQHRLLCGIAESPWSSEEKQRLIAIKDSLKDVDNMLVLLQRLQSHQRQQLQEAYIKLETSRMHLMPHFQQHEGGRLDELNDMEKQFDHLKVEDDSPWVFIDCIKAFFNPWIWHTIAKTAIKIALISVSVSSTYKFRQSGCASPEPVIASKFDFLAIDANTPLDVSYGMG